MFFHILTIIFVIAKILGYITWSWWLVFLPSIIAISIALIFLTVGAYLMVNNNG